MSGAYASLWLKPIALTTVSTTVSAAHTALHLRSFLYSSSIDVAALPGWEVATHQFFPSQYRFPPTLQGRDTTPVLALLGDSYPPPHGTNLLAVPAVS
jgi:hypothetical protein